MNFKKQLLIAACVVLSLTSFAADKLAIARPVGKGGIPDTDIEAFWGILESSIHSDDYVLVSRGALQQMMEEIGLTSSSNLLDINSQQKAKLGKLQGVKFILVSEIAKFGTKMNCTIRIMESSTGEIDQKRTANLRVADLDELADTIEEALERVFSTTTSSSSSQDPGEKVKPPKKKYPKSAILSSAVKNNVSARYPDYFNAQLESSLLENGVVLPKQQSVAQTLREKKMNDLSEIDSKTSQEIGKLFDAEILFLTSFTRFDITLEKKSIGLADKVASSITGTDAGSYTCNYSLRGNVRIVDAKTGGSIAIVRFEEKNTLDSLPNTITAEECGEMILKNIILYKIVPEIMSSPAFKDRIPAIKEKQGEAGE